MSITEKLKEERKRNGYTQQEVADFLCIARGAYAQYETGKNVPPIQNLIKLAELYKVSIDYLVGRYK